MHNPIVIYKNVGRQKLAFNFMDIPKGILIILYEILGSKQITHLRSNAISTKLFCTANACKKRKI